MQKAELVLAMLNQTSKKDKRFKFQRLYRNFFNPDFYLYAYSKICSNEGNMTKGTDGMTIDGFGKKIIYKIIEELKQERFNPASVRRVYIPKKNNQKRPLGIPSFKDKLVQEVLKVILEAIYEPVFSNNSHGFRPNRSCHTALHQIKNQGIGTNWIIEGDIKNYFDTIDHDILLDILKEKIEDGRLIELIKKFLKAGYISEGITYNTITGTPQGGIVSPILANIYLHEFDVYMETLIQKYTKGKKRKTNREHKNIINKCYHRRKAGKIEENNKLFKQLRNISSVDVMDPDFVRVKYIRYADDFVVLIIGSKELAKEIRNEINIFLKEKLRLELNLEKTVITNILKNKVRFLGYEINKVKDNNKFVRDSQGKRRRSINGIIRLSVPTKVINSKIKLFTREGKPAHRKDRINLPILKIINRYNAEMRGLYNFYRMAHNVGSLLHKFKFYHYFSLLNTICIKENISIMKMLKKYGISVPKKNGTGTRIILGVKYSTKRGEKVLIYFNDPIKRIKRPLRYDVDIENGNISGKPYCELIVRLNKGTCELCNKKNSSNDIVVHHIRKLYDLIETYKNNQIPFWLNVMKEIRRKTLVVCQKCHNEIHNY